MLRKLLFVGAIGVMGCVAWQSYSNEPAARVTELRNPALPGSVSPSLSATPDGKIILSWLEPAASELALRFALWNGKIWSLPMTVVRRSDFDVYAEAPPSVLKLDDGTLVAIWGQKVRTADQWAGSYVFSSVSADSGNHWSGPVRVHSDASPREHSFSSAISLTAKQVAIIWLDARNKPTTHRYQLMSAVIDSKGTVSDESTVDEDTCTCCPTALTKTTGGAVAAYRGHDADEIRDIKVARLDRGAWQAPGTVHDDAWKINGCPVNGPALASNGNRVAIVWFTGSGDKPVVKFALSDDRGAAFRAPTILDAAEGENRPVGHVAVSLLDDGSGVAIWLHHQAAGTEVVGERISASGQRNGMFTVASDTETSLGYPRAQRLGNQLVVSWGGGRTSQAVKTALVAVQE
jgi:hypothetical protein